MDDELSIRGGSLLSDPPAQGVQASYMNNHLPVVNYSALYVYDEGSYYTPWC